MNKNKKFRPVVYRPQVQTQDDIQKGLRRAFQGARQSQQGGFGKPISMKQKPIARKREQPAQKPMFQQPSFKPYPQREQYRQQELERQQPEEMPYWSAEEWEEWAYDLYTNYPEVRDILPEWFIEAMESEEQQD